jgi:oligopeptidase B
VPDVCVFHETDPQFYVHAGRSLSEEYIGIVSGSSITNETRIIPTADPKANPRVVIPRQQGVEYSIDHRGDWFYVTIRDDKRFNSEVYATPVANPASTGITVLAHQPSVKIEDLCVTDRHLVVFSRVDGLQQATIYPISDGQPEDLRPKKKTKTTPIGHPIRFPDPAYEMTGAIVSGFKTDTVRLWYTSMTTPNTVLDVNLATHRQVTRKVTPVLGGFDPNQYESKRIWAKATDGTRIPLSLAYKKSLFQEDGSNPLLMDAYGAYEIPYDACFNAKRLSLLDRGVVIAIGHVRGGGDMGRLWYEKGKFLHKKNTFTDLVACAEKLVADRITSPDRLCISGRSAGGLTMGATLNLRPDLFHAVILGVPFVDVLTTMMDETIPLTSIEWEEWGNPLEDAAYYEYMKSYSPVDNVRELPSGEHYPHMLMLAGLHDPRVGYWEPAKFCAKLRSVGAGTGGKLLCLKTDMGAGHFSKTGRFDALKEVAVEYAFLLKVLGSKIKASEPYKTQG